MKRALILNAINPRIGGVLIRGKKGTAKSTAVRALAAILPEVTVIGGCPYSCRPTNPQWMCKWCEPGERQGRSAQELTRQVRIVELPVAATEDRLVGTLDVEHAIRTGHHRFEPGLIAAANRGILYVDEVNLLNDHLVDGLLDAAAMGRNYVEREGISVSHAAEFILVGTMNPEEGEIRPQLLDRFALGVEVGSTFSAEERQEVVRRRIDYEADPEGFITQWQDSETDERSRIFRGKELLSKVRVSPEMLELMAHLCAESKVDGLRADIVMYKTASTIAAYESRRDVIPDDVREAAEMTLLHRQRRQPFEQNHLTTDQLDALTDDFRKRARHRESSNRNANSGEEQDDGDPHLDEIGRPSSDPAGDTNTREERFEIGAPVTVPGYQVKTPDSRARAASGRTVGTVSDRPSGRYVSHRVPPGKSFDLALDATLRAAAPHQTQRRGRKTSRAEHRPALQIESADLREKVRETKAGSLIVFVVDASGSMAAQRRMVAVKGTVLSLLLDAYERRDRVALITFRGQAAQVLLPPTGSVELAHTHLAEMPTGGRTPLSSGLQRALEVVEREWAKDCKVVPLIVLLSDGRANVAMGGDAQTSQAMADRAGTALPVSEAMAVAGYIKQRRIQAVVIDTETHYLRMGLVERIAEAMDAPCVRLESLDVRSLTEAVLSQLS